MPIRPLGITIDNEMFVYETFLTAEASSGASALTVQNISNFAINQVLLIGELGDENSEIIKTHTATAPSGSTITLASNLVHTHSPYVKIRVMLYDQVEISHADTKTGAKSVLVTKDIQSDAVETRYDDASKSSGYYFTRYKNSITTTYSEYSDPIPYTGYETNTVGFVVNYALKRNKMKAFTDFVDYEFCIDEINSCLKIITGKLKGWSKLLKLDYAMGQTARGVNKIALPSDIWEDKGIKSILGVRVGTKIELDPKSVSEMEDKMAGSIQTQVRTEATAGDITLEVDNSYDFGDTGSVDVYISGELYTITYTGITRSATAGVLTGVPASGTGSISVTIPVGTNVWYGEASGSPAYFSVDSDGNLMFWPMASAVYDNLNVCIDYWTGPTEVDSDTDVLDTFRYDMCKYYLTWAIRMQNQNDGKRDLTDGDHIQFLTILNDYVRNERNTHRKKRGVKLNSITL